jgi:hypothetical protein
MTWPDSYSPCLHGLPFDPEDGFCFYNKLLSMGALIGDNILSYLEHPLICKYHIFIAWIV